MTVRFENAVRSGVAGLGALFLTAVAVIASVPGLPIFG